MMLKKIIRRIKKMVKGNSPIKGNHNNIDNKGVFYKVVFDINGNNNIISIGKNTTIKNTLIYIRGNNHSIIFQEGCYMHGGELWIEDHSCSIIVKNKTTIEHAHLAVTENGSVLEIGEDCMLAKNIEIRTGDSHSIIDLSSGNRINKAASVCLADHVWVGNGATILKGVAIGENAVVATGAIVTSNVPPETLVAGVPAKTIKTSITWDRNR